jgi:hypothetical protein
MRQYGASVALLEEELNLLNSSSTLGKSAPSCNQFQLLRLRQSHHPGRDVIIRGCAYVHGAALAADRCILVINETTCGCQTWSSLPCDGGKEEQRDQWHLLVLRGPGWKPPAAMAHQKHTDHRHPVGGRPLGTHRLRINNKRI